MPVIEHDVHPSVIQRSGAVYGCKDRNCRTGYFVLTRNYFAGEYELLGEFVEHRMSTECRYDHSLTDAKCAGCKHRGSGEAYDKSIREKGLK